MKLFTFVLLAVTCSSAHAQTVVRTTNQEMVSGLPFWNGSADRRQTYTSLDAIGLVNNDQDDEGNVGNPDENDRTREYLSHLTATGRDEGECTRNLFNQSMTKTIYPDFTLQSYVQDYSMGSLVDRGFLNFSGFQIIAGKALAADGNEYDVSMKLNYREVTKRQVRTELRSGKVLQNTENKLIRCYYNKGGEFGHTILSVKNKDGIQLIKLYSSSTQIL